MVLHSFNAHFEGVHTVSAVDAAAGAQGKNKQHIISQNESLDPDLNPTTNHHVWGAPAAVKSHFPANRHLFLNSKVS